MFDTQIFSSYMLPSVLALIMFGMGMSLTKEDFQRLLQNPIPVLAGLGSQMLLLPAFAFLVAWASGLPPEFQVGLVLISACPGGATSNLISYLLKGNLALSVSMTTVNSFLVIFTIPIIVNLGLMNFAGSKSELSMPFWNTVIQILAITVLPCVAGIFTHYRFPNLVRRLENPLKVIMPIALAVAMLAAIILEKRDGVKVTTAEYFDVLPWAFLLNAGGMLLGLGIGRGIGLGLRDSMTIGIEVGLQNSGLAIAVATSSYILNEPRLAIPATVYALFSFFTAVIFGLIVNRKEIHTRDLLKGLIGRKET